MNYWLLKTDADTYSFADLQRDGRTIWDGVRNYQARNNIRAMQPGDIALIYHSVTDKCVVGIAEIITMPFPEPNDLENKWTAVDIKPIALLKRPISLDEIKADAQLEDLPLIKQSRLSVMPISQTAYDRILYLSNLQN